MENFLYTSEYYCDVCKCYHSVAIFSEGEKLIVNDSDGETIDEFNNLEEVLNVYPDEIIHTILKIPNRQIQKWYALIGSSFSVQALKCGGNPFSKKAEEKRSWIHVKDAPIEVLQTLNINEDEKIGDVSSWKELESLLPNINGKRLKFRKCFTTIISFEVSILIDG